MYCTKCGAPNPDGNFFCQACGNRLQAAPVPSQIPVSPAPSPIPQPEPIPAPQSDPAPVSAEPQCSYAPSQTPDEPAPQQPVYQVPVQPIPQAPVYQPPVRQMPTQYGQYTYPPQAPQKPPKPKKQRKPRTAPPPAPTGLKVGTVFLCIALCFFFVLTSLLGLVRDFLQEDTLEDILSDIDLNDIDDVGALFAELGIEDVTLPDGRDDVSVAELIYENLTPESQKVFSKKTIRNALEDEKVRSFLIDTIIGYTQYYTDGEKMQTIDAEDIADFIDRNIRRLSDGEMTSLTRSEYNDLVTVLNDTIDFDALSRSSLQETIPVDPDLTTFLCSPILFWAMVVVTLALFVLILVLNRRNLCACVPHLGVSLIVVGALELLLTIGCLCITLFAGGLFLSLISPVLTHIATYFALPGGIALALGLLAVIGGGKLKKRDKASLEAQQD